MGIIYRISLRKNPVKVGCVLPKVVVSILPHAEFGPSDHQEDAPHFIRIRLNSLTGIQMLVVIFYLYQWLEIIRYAKRLIKSVWILLL